MSGQRRRPESHGDDHRPLGIRRVAIRAAFLSACASLAVTIGLAVIVSLLADVIPLSPTATVVRGNRIFVSRAETIDDDVFVFATRAVIDGTVQGNFGAATAFVNTVGPIDGTLTLVTGRAEVRGPVGGDVRAVGASVAIYGTVAGDLVVAGGSVTLVEGATIAGNLVVAGGAVKVVRDATVGGDVRGVAGSVDIEGRIVGDVRLTVRRLEIAPGARIDGALRYRSGTEAIIGTGAIIRGPIERNSFSGLLPLGSVLLWAHGALPRLLAMLVAGAVILLLLPRHTVAVADAVHAEPIEALCMGFWLAICLPIALLFLALTVVGFPLALVGAVGIAGSLYLSQAFVGLALGRLLLRLPEAGPSRMVNLAAMAIGVVGVAGIRQIPISGIGLLVSSATAIYGLGAVAVAVGRRASIPARTNPAGRGWRGLPGAGILGAVAGYLLGFSAFVAITIAAVAGTFWSLGIVLMVGTSISLTMPVERRELALAAGAAMAAAVGAGAIAVRIYRRW